jgi:hypothetical protein
MFFEKSSASQEIVDEVIDKNESKKANWLANLMVWLITTYISLFIIYRRAHNTFFGNSLPKSGEIENKDSKNHNEQKLATELKQHSIYHENQKQESQKKPKSLGIYSFIIDVKFRKKTFILEHGRLDSTALGNMSENIEMQMISDFHRSEYIVILTGQNTLPKWKGDYIREKYPKLIYLHEELQIKEIERKLKDISPKDKYVVIGTRRHNSPTMVTGLTKIYTVLKQLKLTSGILNHLPDEDFLMKTFYSKIALFKYDARFIKDRSKSLLPKQITISLEDPNCQQTINSFFDSQQLIVIKIDDGSVSEGCCILQAKHFEKFYNFIMGNDYLFPSSFITGDFIYWESAREKKAYKGKKIIIQEYIKAKETDGKQPVIRVISSIDLRENEIFLHWSYVKICTSNDGRKKMHDYFGITTGNSRNIEQKDTEKKLEKLIFEQLGKYFQLLMLSQHNKSFIVKNKHDENTPTSQSYLTY